MGEQRIPRIQLNSTEFNDFSLPDTIADSGWLSVINRFITSYVKLITPLQIAYEQ